MFPESLNFLLELRNFAATLLASSTTMTLTNDDVTLATSH